MSAYTVAVVSVVFYLVIGVLFASVCHVQPSVRNAPAPLLRWQTICWLWPVLIVAASLSVLIKNLKRR